MQSRTQSPTFKQLETVLYAGLLCVVPLPFNFVNAQSTLDSIVVTPTRTARTVDETIAPVTVITRDDIDSTGATSLPDVLRAAAGIEMSSNGAYGKATGLFIRGTETDHVLVLVDGVKLYSATLGRTSVELIPVDQIDRIEVVRGPRASLYGAEALGGVIHIFTRRDQSESGTRLSVGYGSDSSSDISAGFSGASANTRYHLNVNRFDTDGIDITDEAQLDEDGYENTSISGSVNFIVNEETGFGFDLLHAAGETAFDNTFDTPDAIHDSDFGQLVVSARANFQPTSTWSSELRLSNSKEDRDSFRNDEFENRFDTNRTELSWQNDILIGETHLLTAGVDYSDDEVESTTVFDIDSRDNTGVYMQWQGDYDRQGIVAAIRYDDNEQFGGQSNGSIDYRFDINPSLRFRIGAGTGFKAPSFNELYFPDFGNADLEVEQAESYEIGLQGDLAGGLWSATWFDSEIDNLIAFDNATFLPVNIARAEISGLELDYRAELAGWTLSTGLNLLRPEDADTGNRLIRRAETDLRISLARDLGPVRAGISAIYTGKRFEDAANEQALDSFALVNLNGRWNMNDTVGVELNVENLFDEDYETAAGFNERGRTFFIRLRLQP